MLNLLILFNQTNFNPNCDIYDDVPSVYYFSKWEQTINTYNILWSASTHHDGERMTYWYLFQAAIDSEEAEKRDLEAEKRKVEDRLQTVTASLNQKLATKVEYDKVIGEAEGHYMKILESSQVGCISLLRAYFSFGSKPSKMHFFEVFFWGVFFRWAFLGFFSWVFLGGLFVCPP